VLVHGWDLAVATGQDYALDPELMQACTKIIEPQLDAFRSAGALAPQLAVPARCQRADSVPRDARQNGLSAHRMPTTRAEPEICLASPAH